MKCVISYYERKEANKMEWKNTLMAYEEDVESRGFWDWVKAHTSFMKPLHRYERFLELSKEKITFTGKDVKEDKDFNLEIAIVNITNFHFGFDDVFTGWEDRAAPWNKPLNVRYKSKEGGKTIYLFTNFHRKYGFRASDNKEVFEKLESYLRR
jgi:hypothetical protein